MNEEVTTAQSAETTNQTTAPVVSEPSLEDIYKEAGVNEVKPQTKAEPAPIAPSVRKIGDIPDPYDDRFKPAIQTELQAQEARLAAIEAHQQTDLRTKAIESQKAADLKLVEDIKTASTYIMENAGFKDLPFSEEAQLTLANTELELKAKTDPKFQALWYGRDKNPEAWKKALAIVTKEIGKKFEAKVDPKLAADRRALRATQNSSATTEQESNSNSLDGLTGAEFDRAWANLARGRTN